MKRILLLIICALMLAICACCAAENEGYTEDGFSYTIAADGTAVITGYSGSESDLTVPSVLGGRPVTGIGDLAFRYVRKITSVTLPDSISAVGRNPFYGCTSLTEIKVSPESPYLAVIDGVLFSKPDRRLVTYPVAKDWTSYTVPNGIRIIGYCAFYYAQSLTSVTLPEGLASIEDSAFFGCSGLTSVCLPDSVLQVGANPFCYCSSLAEIKVSPESPYLAVIDGVLFSKPDRRLVTYPMTKACSSHAVPNGIMIISRGAFLSNDYLTSVTLPDGLTSIGPGAFNRCSSLTSINLPGSLTEIGDVAFSYCPSLTATVTRGSCAAEYCRANGINYVYTDSLDWLNG